MIDLNQVQAFPYNCVELFIRKFKLAQVGTFISMQSPACPAKSVIQSELIPYFWSLHAKRLNILY